MPTIAFDVTADTKAMVRKIQQLEGHVGRLRNRLKGTGNKGAASFSKAGTEIKNMVGTLVGVAGVSGAVMRVVDTVKNAYKTMLDEHRKFMGNIEKTAAAKGRFLWNFGGVEEKQRAEELAGRVASGAGIGLDRAYDILSTAYSSGARGKTLEESSTFAGVLERLGIGQGGEMVKAAVNLEKITGVKETERNFGFLREVGKAASLTDLHSQLNLMAAMSAGTAAGDTPEEIAELTAAVSHLMAGADPEGRITATTVANLVKVLRQKELVPTAGGGWRRAEGKSTMALLADLQGAFAGTSEARQADIMQRLGGEGKATGALRHMVSKSPVYSKYMEQTQAEITSPTAPEGLANLRSFIKSFESGAERLVHARKRAQTAIETGGTIGREPEAARTAARDLGLQWAKQQGFQGAWMSATANMAYGWNDAVSPEQYLNLARNLTPDEQRKSTPWKQFESSMLEIIAVYREADRNTAAAYKELNAAGERMAKAAEQNTAAAQRIAHAAEVLASSRGQRASQDID